MSETVSVIVPTYNEKENIKPLIERVHQALAGYEHEILIVDDNSKDGTAEAAEELTRTYPVKVLVRKDERGLGTAVVHGVKNSSGNLIVVMDADLQHPPEVVPVLVKALQCGADFVVASRYIPGGGVPNWGLFRRIVSKTAIAIAHVLLPITRKIKDATSGFFAFQREGIAGAELRPIGYKIMLEILVEGKFNSTLEVPYIFKERSTGISKFNTRQQVEYLRHLFSMMKRTGELTRFVKFLAVGLSGVVVNMGALWLLTRFGGLPYYVSSLFAIELSIISNFALNDYFTFADRRNGNGNSFLSRLLRFNVTCAVGAAIQYGLLLLFTSVFGVHYLISNIIGIAAGTLWNYLVNVSWTWK